MKMRRTFPVTGGSNGGVITKFLICTLLLSRFRPERFNTSEFGMFDCPSQPQEDRCRDTRRPGPAPDRGQVRHAHPTREMRLEERMSRAIMLGSLMAEAAEDFAVGGAAGETRLQGNLLDTFGRGQ